MKALFEKFFRVVDSLEPKAVDFMMQKRILEFPEDLKFDMMFL